MSHVPAQAYGCAGPSYFDGEPAEPLKHPEKCPDPNTAGITCHLKGNKFCAALNRGLIHLGDDILKDAKGAAADALLAQAYQIEPYNVYSKVYYEKCPGLYTFAFDDVWQDAAPAVFAMNTEVNFKWCPNETP